MKKFLPLLLSLLPAAAFAAVPPQIQFEGQFSSTGSLPSMVFRIVDSPSSDVALEGWSETTAPFTADGRVSYLLGSQTPLPDAIFAAPAVNRYLWVKVGSEAPARQKLVSIPYAFRAGIADALRGGSVIQGGVTTDNAFESLRVRGQWDQVVIEETDGPPNEKQWITKADAGDLSWLTANDAHTAFGEYMKVTRTGPAVDQVLFPSSARVGIGTYNPQAELEVNGSLRVTGTGINKDIELNSPIRPTVLPFGPNVPDDLAFQVRSAGNGMMQINYDNPGPVLIAAGGGNVGIGAISFTDKLTVGGTIRSASGGFKFPDGTIQITAASGAGGGVKPADNVTWTGVHAWTQTANFQNRLGIGTSNPQRELEVNGSLRVTGTGINKDIELNSPIRPTVLPYGPNVPDDLDFQVRSAGGGTMQINYDNPGAVLIAAGGGRVGVGLATSADKLTVDGAVYATSGGFRFPDGTLQTTAASGVGGGVRPGDNVSWTGVHAWTQTANFQNRLGIGTSNPQRELEVNGALRVTGTGINKDIELNSPIRATVLPFGPNVPTNLDFQIRSAHMGTMQVNNDNPGNVTLAVGGGSVGVGTASPAFKLDVNGSVNAAGFLKAGVPLVSSQWVDVSGGVKYAGGDVSIGAAGKGLVLKATNGPNCFRVTVNNAGTLSAAVVACP